MAIIGELAVLMKNPAYKAQNSLLALIANNYFYLMLIPLSAFNLYPCWAKLLH